MAVKSCKIQYIIRIDLGIFPQVTCVKIFAIWTGGDLRSWTGWTTTPAFRHSAEGIWFLWLFQTWCWRWWKRRLALGSHPSWWYEAWDVDGGDPGPDVATGSDFALLQLFWIGIRIGGCHTTERFTDLWDYLETSKALWVVFISSKCFCLKWCMATQTCQKRLRGNEFLSWCFGAVSPLFV